MNVDALFSTLTNPAYFQTGTLTLPSGAFGEGGFDTLASDWFPMNQLVITQIAAAPTKSGNTVVVSGQMNFLGVANQAVKTVVFFLVDGNGNPSDSGDPEVFIDFPLPVQSQFRLPWVFSTSFPKLAGSPLDQLTFLDSASFLLSSAALTATQAATVAGQGYPAVAAGLNFHSGSLITTTSLYADIQPLLGTAATLTVGGPITILSGSAQAPDTLVPGITISSSPPIAAPFLGADVVLQIVNPWDQTKITQLDPALLIAIVVQIKTGVPITLSADFANLGKVLVLEADVGDAVTYGLTELSSWLGNAPFGQVFSAYSFSLPDAVTVQNLRLYINLRMLSQDAGKSLSAVSITLGTVAGKSWEIVKDYFTVDGISVSFMLNNPLGTQDLITSVLGKVTLDGVELEAFGSFPDTSFGLSTSQPVDLTQVFSGLGVDVSGFPDLVLNNFYVEATPEDGPYSVSMDVSSDWRIDVGLRDIELTQAGLTLQYVKSDSPSISGQALAIATLVPKDGGGDLNVPEFEVNWNIPGKFVLQGTFPDISLSDLATAIAAAADLSLPSDFPDLQLTNSTLSLTVSDLTGGNQLTGTTYDFLLETTVSLGSQSGLTFVAQVLKSPTGTGFAAGIWTDDWQWSPADFQPWNDIFGTILSGITFERSGLVVSSLDNAQIVFSGAPSDLPQTVKKGLTFFTEIGFGTSPLKTLVNFFGNQSGLQLYAYLADPLVNSQFIAKIGDSTTTNKYAFTGLEVIVSPASESFSLQAGVSFTFNDVGGNQTTLTFIGGGTISLTGAFDLYFILKGDGGNPLPGSGQPPSTSPGWQNPLGISGLTINNFWGEIGVEVEGDLILGFGGDIIVKDVELDLALVGGFEADVPFIDVFQFGVSPDSPGSKVSITDLISSFTQLDLGWVPILSALELKEFFLAVVLDPNGWRNPVTQTLWLPGFYCSGDVTFYGFEAIFDIEIIFERGIKASGSINEPLVLGGGVFKLADASGTKGPTGMIDTLDLSGPGSNTYLQLSASLTLLAMTDTITATVTNDGWNFNWRSSDFIFTDVVTCSLSGGDFAASTSGDLSLDINTGSGVNLNGFEIIPSLDFTMGLSLNVTIDINPGFQFNVAGGFEFGGEDLTVSVGLDITSWSDLESALITYFEQNPEILFNDLITNPEKWAKALAAGAFTVATDVVQLLSQAFQVADHVAAQILDDIGMPGEQIINGLVQWWGVTEEVAEDILDGIENCSIAQALKSLD